MEKRELVIPLKAIEENFGVSKQYFDLDTEKRGSNFQLTFSKRHVSNRNTLLKLQKLSVRMTKPEIQQLVSELTKILLFND